MRKQHSEMGAVFISFSYLLYLILKLFKMDGICIIQVFQSCDAKERNIIPYRASARSEGA